LTRLHKNDPLGYVYGTIANAFQIVTNPQKEGSPADVVIVGHFRNGFAIDFVVMLI
jgi:hypothetical protein